MAALRWLKNRNKLYASIDLNSSWLEDSEKDDTELCTAMTTVPTESKDASEQQNTTQHTDDDCMFSAVLRQVSGEHSHYTAETSWPAMCTTRRTCRITAAMFLFTESKIFHSTTYYTSRHKLAVLSVSQK